MVFWLSAGFLVLLVLFALFGPFFLPDYNKIVGSPNQFSAPGQFFGTDESGRSIAARLAYGTRISLFVGLLVQAIALVVGIIVGVTGVYAPRWISVPLMRFTDGMFAFPDLLLAILIVGIFGASLNAVIVALSITAWPAVARLVKTQVATLKDREFVMASQALGAKTPYLVVKHILPHLWGILLAVSMVELAATILAESSLSFLGIGVQAPMPSWGSMINSARQGINSHPEILLWPCLFLSATIFALNFVGDGLRALTDPKSR